MQMDKDTKLSVITKHQKHERRYRITGSTGGTSDGAHQ
jgi:hypothetical protein